MRTRQHYLGVNWHRVSNIKLRHQDITANVLLQRSNHSSNHLESLTGRYRDLIKRPWASL